MPTSTYDLIQSQTLGSSASTVTFSSLGTYQDLVLIVEGTHTNVSSSIDYLTFNGSASTYATMSNYAGAAGSTGVVGIYSTAYLQINNVGTDPFMLQVDIFNYRSTNTEKHYISRGSAGQRSYDMNAGRWTSTNAITSVEVNTLTSFAAGTTFNLYGISVA
jgi:hypothetical protein